MKKLFCICILACLLLTSCGGGGEDLNVYTTESKPETSTTQLSTDAVDTTSENIIVKTPDIPEELRVYVDNYSYDPSDDSNTFAVCRYTQRFAVCGDYLYYADVSSPQGKSVSVLKCLNMKTGEISSPCFDPVCTHNTFDCDFYFLRISSIHAYGKYIVMSGIKEAQLNVQNSEYVYDVTTGKVYKDVFSLMQADRGNTYISCIQDDIFDYAIDTYDNPNATGEHDKTIYEFQLWKYNIPTGERTVVFKSSNTFNEYNFLIAYGGRLYYSQYFPESDQRKIYSMLPDQSDIREENNFCFGDYYVGDLIWNVKSENGAYEIFCTDVNSGERKILAKSDQYEMGQCLTDQYLYYSYIVPDENGQSKSQLWRCDHNGNNKEQLITYDGVLRYFTIYGNYIFSHCTVGEIYKIERVHVETGEVLYIE